MYSASDKTDWQAEERSMRQTVVVFPDKDVVGPGRYILSFVLAGIVGLAIQYGLRKSGWTPTWINAVIFVILVTLFAATG